MPEIDGAGKDLDRYVIPQDAGIWALPVKTVESPEVLAARRAVEREKALRRIQRAKTGSPGDQRGLLGVWGYKKSQWEKLSHKTASELAHRLVAADLLTVEFFDDTGYLTMFAEVWFPKVDPLDYKALPMQFSDALVFLAARMGITRQRDTSAEYAGYIGRSSGNSDADIVHRYVDKYGKTSLIFLPHYICIADGKASIGTVRGFVWPYGGHNFDSDRTVFVPKDEEFFISL